MNKRSTFFSLVLTAHRREYLAEALLSVCAQTDKDFEFVLCLDLRKDEDLPCYCTDIFESIQCTKKNLVTIIGNGTAGLCRNEAFGKTTGKWISYLDGDDMISPIAIETMKKYIFTHETYDIFSSGMIKINTDGVCVNIPNSLSYYPSHDIYRIDPETINSPTYFNQFQVMRREVWEQYKYDISSNGEDIDFMLINMLRWKYLKVPQYLYFYRDVQKSFSKETYVDGDFTTKRYRNGFYMKYYEDNYSDFFSCNFND